MAPISDELRTSLFAITSQIEKAEALLRKQPGGAKASVLLFEGDWGKDAFLEFVRERDEEGSLCVAYYDGYGDRCHSKSIQDFPVTARIDLCYYIPDLLDSAVAAQEEVAKDALEAAAAIEQALAKHR